MFYTAPLANPPRLSLLASVVLMTLSVGVSQAQITERNTEPKTIHYADSNTYTTTTVLPDGTIIGSKTTNHGKGAVQTLRMPNLDNVRPKVNPVIGKDQNGNPIREREKKLRDLTWKQAAQLMKDYNDAVKVGKAKPIEPPAENQLQYWQRMNRESLEYEKKYGPIQTSKRYVLPGSTPEDSAVVREKNTRVRFNNGVREYLVYDEEGNLKQIVRPQRKTPYVAKFKKPEPVRRELGSKVIYSSDEQIDLTDVNNPATKRIKALFPDIGKTPKQKRYIIRQNDSGNNRTVPRSKSTSWLEDSVSFLLGIKNAAAQEPSFNEKLAAARGAASPFQSEIEAIAKSARDLQAKFKGNANQSPGAVEDKAAGSDGEGECTTCGQPKGATDQETLNTIQAFNKDILDSTQKAQANGSQFDGDLNAVVRSVGGGNSQSSFLAEMQKILEDHPDVRKALPNVDEELKTFASQLSDATSNTVPANAPERTLIFVSYSMSETALIEAFQKNKNRRDVLFVMQGIPVGMNIATGVKKMQELAAKVEPTPNIVLDPGLFEAYDVKVVPTIVRAKGALRGAPLPGKTERAYPNLLGKVRGLTSDEWLIDQLNDGKTGDLGTEGNTTEIAEPNLIDVMKERVAKIDWAEKKKKAFERAWLNQTFDVLPTAREDREREIDPTFVVENDFKDAAGNLIRAKGEQINPLEIRPFTLNMLVFNPLSRREKKRVDQLLAQFKAEGYEKPLLIGTQIDREKGFGWDSYKEITDYFDAHLFMLTPEVKETWSLEHTPALITADNERHVFRVFELGPIENEEAILAEEDRQRAEAQK